MKKKTAPLCLGVRASPISYLWRGREVASHACYTTVLPLLPLRARFRQKRAREQGSRPQMMCESVLELFGIAKNLFLVSEAI